MPLTPQEGELNQFYDFPYCSLTIELSLSFSALYSLAAAALLLASAPLHAQPTPASATAPRPVLGQAAAPAPKMQLEVAVSDSSTTYLVFPGPVSLVDVGQAPYYLVKIETNAVFVRARRKNPPTLALAPADRP